MKTQDIKNMASAYMQVLQSELEEKKMDPVGQEDDDIDNDGDVDSSDKYLKARRKAISKAIKKDDKMDEQKVDELTAAQKKLPPALQKAIKDKEEKEGKSMKEKLQVQKEAIVEREMTDAEKKKREEIVVAMKDKEDEFKDRYGKRWKEVMYATATKQAMESVDKALEMTKNLLTKKESFDTADTKWPVYAKIKEDRAMHTKGAAPGDPKMGDQMTASDKAFIDAHNANGLDGIDSGIDGNKAAEDTAKNAAAQVKAGAGMNRTGDQKTGDKNIVKSTEAE